MTAAELWTVALDPRAYIAQMTMNRELFKRRVDETSITPRERAAFSSAPLRVLAITEDFCGDSAQFIPPVIRLSQGLENVDVALLLRPQHQEFAGRYRRADGYQAIPVLILLDQDGRELGHLIERPARARDAMAAETRRFARANPHLAGVSRTYDRMPDATKAAVRSNMERFRDSQQAEWTHWLFEDLAAIVTQHAARSTATSPAAG